MSAISCLNTNGMIGTSHTSSSKESLFAPCSPLFPSLFPFPVISPSHKSKSRLGFNDGRSWSLGQTPVAAGGPCKSNSLPPLPPPLCIVQPNVGPAPHPVWPRAAPKHRGCYCLPPACPLRATHPPSLLHHEVCSPTPLCSLFVQGQSNPSSCRLNLHTKDQCKDHQLCGYKSRVHSKKKQKKPHTNQASTQICVYLGAILFLQVYLCNTYVLNPVRYVEHCAKNMAFG